VRNKIKLNPVDYSTITYLLITTILVLLFFNKIENPIYHIFMRMGFFGILLVSVFARNNLENKLVKLLSSLIPLAFLGFFYNETASFNHLFFNNFDGIVSRAELDIFGVQPSIEFSQVFNHPWFSELMNFGYFSYYLLIFGTPILFFYKQPEHFQKILFVLLTSFYLYYIVFIIIPVVGPQFYFQGDLAVFTPQGPFGHLIRFIQETGEVPTGAFPSSHVGISILLGYYIFKYFKKYFLATSLIITILILSTVYIKAHYVLDVFAAFIVTPIFYYTSNKLYISISKPNQNI
jgi:membrane-associated phospholipid phosphatase